MPRRSRQPREQRSVSPPVGAGVNGSEMALVSTDRVRPLCWVYDTPGHLRPFGVRLASTMAARAWTMRRVGAFCRRVSAPLVSALLAAVGCGGKIGTVPSEVSATGGAGGTDASTGGTGALSTGTGGTAPDLADQDAGLEDSTDDPCPCPAPERLDRSDSRTVARFESLGCYCSGSSCPSTLGQAAQSLCARLEENSKGKVLRSTGCGLARVTLMGGTYSFEWLFEEVGGTPIGAASYSDVPGGRCNVYGYVYGVREECLSGATCWLCGDPDGLEPSCLRPL